MKTLLIKAVVLTDGEHYLIHGSDSESPEEMFKAMAPIWAFDPLKETVHFVELSVNLPELENPKAEPSLSFILPAISFTGLYKNGAREKGTERAALVAPV